MADFDKNHGGASGPHFFAPIDNTEPVEVGTADAPEGECVAPAPAPAVAGNSRRMR